MGNSSFELSFAKKDVYQNWIEIIESRKRTGSAFGPLISVIVPVYNVSKNILKDCIESVLNQSYSNFELCLADDASTFPEVRETLDSYKDHSKIKIAYRKENGGISACTNTALELASGDFVGLLDCDDLLSRDALSLVAEAAKNHPDAEMFYSDEDHISEDGKLRQKPHFKPDFSPDTLLGQMYICHFMVIKKELLDKIGGLLSVTDGSQDYDLALRCSMYAKEVVHIPHILYHWRIRGGSTADNVASKPYVYEAAALAQRSAIKRMGADAHLEEVRGRQWRRIVYNPGEFKILDDSDIKGAKIIETEKGRFLLFLSDAVEPVFPDTLEKAVSRLLGQAMESHVGAVGCKLYEPSKEVIYSDGIISTGDGYMDALRGWNDTDDFYWDRNLMDHDVYAVRRDVMVVSMEKYEKVNGFSGQGIKSDAEFGKALLDMGFYNVVRNDVVFRKTATESKDSEEIYGINTPADPFYHSLFARERGINTYTPDMLKAPVKRLFFWPKYKEETAAFIEEITESRGQIRISGWACDTKTDSNNNFDYMLCLVLSRFSRFSVPVIRTQRKDLITALPYSDVEESGFVCVFEKSQLKAGVYKVGIISKNGVWVSERTITV